MVEKNFWRSVLVSFSSLNLRVENFYRNVGKFEVKRVLQRKTSVTFQVGTFFTEALRKT